MSVYHSVQGAPQPINNNNQTTIVQLRLPDKGTFVVFGRVAFHNADAAAAHPLDTVLTTLNGQTELDKVSFNVDPVKEVCATVHGILDLNNAEHNDVVDIRCASANGNVAYGALTAFLVDDG